jgi:preprotein translocase subunit SecB
MTDESENELKLTDPTQAPGQSTGNSERQLILQKIYIKDFSFESPKAPDVFTTNLSPQTQLNMRYANKDLGQDNSEVSLTLTVEAKDGDNTVFLAELTYAGVFAIKGYSAEEKATIVGSFCPNTLYPFAREAIADIVQKGGFPQLLLQPINFDALYSQALQQRASQMSGAEAPAPAGGETH